MIDCSCLGSAARPCAAFFGYAHGLECSHSCKQWTKQNMAMDETTEHGVLGGMCAWCSSSSGSRSVPPARHRACWAVNGLCSAGRANAPFGRIALSLACAIGCVLLAAFWQGSRHGLCRRIGEWSAGQRLKARYAMLNYHYAVYISGLGGGFFPLLRNCGLFRD